MPASIQLSAERDKSCGRNWTDEEKDVVWEQVSRAKEDGIPLTESFRKTTKLLPHRSEAAIGMLYYNVLRKERDAAKTPEAHVEPDTRSNPDQEQGQEQEQEVMHRGTPGGQDLMEAFQGLPEYIHQLHQRMDNLEKRVTRPDRQAMADALVELAGGYAQVRQCDEESQHLREEIRRLESSNLQLQDRLEQLNQSYEDAMGIYEMFTNMASISQIMSLGDFKHQMKTTLDKWGNLLSASLERAE